MRRTILQLLLGGVDDRCVGVRAETD